MEHGRNSFSREAADGVRFIVRSRLFEDAEIAERAAAEMPRVGPNAAGEGTIR
ncbi:MAG: hypothetical protein PF501_00305 [Salinisphaera sp.]|nr:hypothetical protein [Salinisphaera sp.]